MKRILRRNIGLKALALGLACVLWWFVGGESNVHVGFAVPLEIRNIPQDSAITNKVDRQVDVRLAGPSTLINTIQQEELSVVVDVAGRKPGRQTIPLTERSVKVPAGFRVERVYPDSIEIVLEKLVRKSVPVVPRIGGGPAIRTKIEETSVDPPSLDVVALPEEFARIKSLYTEEVVPGNPEGVYTAKARVDLADGHARIVGNPVVLVTIQFRK